MGIIIEELNRYTQQDFEELKYLMSHLSERLILKETDLDRVISDNNSHIYVMRNTDNKIIACATLSVFNSPSSRKASIEDVIVHPDFQRQNLGKKLVEHLINEARLFSPIDVQLTSKPMRIAANKLYQLLGFQKKETNFYKMIL